MQICSLVQAPNFFSRAKEVCALAGLAKEHVFLEFLASQLQHCGRHRFDRFVWSICAECSAVDTTMWQETSEDDDDELVADQPSGSYSSTADVTGASSSASAGVRLHVRV